MLVTNLIILVLAGFVGFAVVSKVPNTLHTPLMSGTNAIHGIVVLGALVVFGEVEHESPTVHIVVASLFAAIIGSISFWGSIIAFGKLQELISGSPIGFGRAQQPINVLLPVAAV